MFKFLKEAWKNNKEFENWKKTQGAEEKKLSKAMENIEFSVEVPTVLPITESHMLCTTSKNRH